MDLGNIRVTVTEEKGRGRETGKRRRGDILVMAKAKVLSPIWRLRKQLEEFKKTGQKPKAPIVPVEEELNYGRKCYVCGLRPDNKGGRKISKDLFICWRCDV